MMHVDLQMVWCHLPNSSVNYFDMCMAVWGDQGFPLVHVVVGLIKGEDSPTHQRADKGANNNPVSCGPLLYYSANKRAPHNLLWKQTSCEG